MRLLTFDTGDGPRFGIETPGGILDVAQADASLPDSLHDYLRSGDLHTAALQKLAVGAPPSDALNARENVKLMPPIVAPEKLICIGLNYRDHAAEVKMDLPTYPSVFSKWRNVLIGDGEAIVLPHESDQLDYEAELTIVIGRTARRVSEADALDYVAGYTIFNDVSVRDFQMRTTQWTMGKVFDTHGPCGPVLVTRDEIPDPQALRISTSIGGVKLQDSNTGEMVFTVARLVAGISAAATLEPGDMIATGTPAGVGMSRSPKRWMRPGERVRVEIEKIGALENPIVGPA